MYTDTHCHIHETELYERSAAVDAYARARQADVSTMLCIGTTETSSEQAIEFAAVHPGCFAIVGVHPHDVKNGYTKVAELLQANHSTVVGVGEIGLDYYYNNSPRDTQIAALEQQLQWAHDFELPVSFHVRDAFPDFWPILANFPQTRGVVHSFTDNAENLEQALSRGLYIGLNGISTFTKDYKQQRMYDSIPLDRILLETDAPFLTPAPHRGKVNEPAFVRHIAAYHANRRDIDGETFARTTSTNASALFSVS